MKLKVASLGNLVLRQECGSVSKAELQDTKMQALIDGMLSYVNRRSNKNRKTNTDKTRVAGMSASQFGHPLPIIVVDMAIGNDAFSDIRAFVNPEIVWHSHEMSPGMEACASIPNVGGIVQRYQSVVVRTMDRSGTTLEITATDRVSVLIQHEIDHTKGILFIDRLADPARGHLINKEENFGEYRVNAHLWDRFIDVSNDVVPIT